MIVGRLGWLGAELDEQANNAGAAIISTGASSILLERRPAEEELAIARHMLMLLRR
jgi:acetate kinase